MRPPDKVLVQKSVFVIYDKLRIHPAAYLDDATHCSASVIFTAYFAPNPAFAAPFQGLV
jgi:hypothetical protein